MKNFSKAWNSSKKPGKQRKYRAKAPLHTRQKLARGHLSKELREKYGKRSTTLRKGDKVKITRGQFRKHEGKIEKVDLKKITVFVNGAEIAKKDGSKKFAAISPSNIIITELSLDDKLRQEILERK